MVSGLRMLALVSVAGTGLLSLPLLAQEAAKPAPATEAAVPPAAVAPAAAATDAAKTEIKVTATKPDLKDPDAVICKWESDTGSRVKSTKVCASRREWAENGRLTSKQYQNQGNAQSSSN